jgi:hypothetical protein
MSVGGALRIALVDFYHQSWRLSLLNTALCGVLVAILVAAAFYVPILPVVVLVGGPLAAAVMHCAVTLAQTEDLRLGDAVTGLRLQWRRGLELGLTAAAVMGLGVFAVFFYASKGTWPLAIIVGDLLIVFAVIQLVLWPLAVYERTRPFRAVVRDAALMVLRRPAASLALALALFLVNLAGVAAAVLPFLTLTIAYSFVAAAHFALPRSPMREA